MCVAVNILLAVYTTPTMLKIVFVDLADAQYIVPIAVVNAILVGVLVYFLS
jgi:hypothetical protein